jgi:hypothetical protein
MASDLRDGLALAARELERLTTDLSQIAVRARGAGEALGGPSARACGEWVSVLHADAASMTELAIDIRRTARELDRYAALPAEVREHREMGMLACGQREPQLAWLPRILTGLVGGGEEPGRGGDPSVWSPWSPPVRPGIGPRLAGTDGDRAGTDQGVQVAQLPDRG